MQCQAQRGIVEFTLAITSPVACSAHQSEFTEPRLDGHVRRRGGTIASDGNQASVSAPDTGSRDLPRFIDLAWVVLPLFLLGLAAAWLIVADPMKAFDTGAPPTEKLTFERRVLDDSGIHLKVRAGGSEPMTIAQVQVDEAYWTFKQEPAGDIARVASAWIHIPYPWVVGEAHKVKVVTKTGDTFEHEIAVAVPTPKPHLDQLRPQALVGAFVGILPVAIGLMFYPVLRRLGRGSIDFVLALTVACSLPC
jgi:hypothetical protein